MRRACLIILLTVTLLLFGCGGKLSLPSQREEAAPAPKPTPQHTLQPTPVPTPIPVATTLPTPTPLPEGDFSLTFPKEDTGISADQSYQSDTVRIAINRVTGGGITYYVADIWISSIDSFRTAFGYGRYKGGRQPLKTIMKNNGAILAISGDYYGAREKGVVIRNGEVYRDTPHVDVCVLYRDGRMQTYRRAQWIALQDKATGVYQAWGFGPALLDRDGNPMVLEQFEGFTFEMKHPRAAIGYYEPGHYCFVLVDGRAEGYSEGMLLSELSSLFYELGCKTAYNLDGGATAMLGFEGKYINRPFQQGRLQYDILYIRLPDAAGAFEQ